MRPGAENCQNKLPGAAFGYMCGHWLKMLKMNQSLETVLSCLQKIGATAVLLVGPTRPHLAILVFPKCVQTVRTFAGKLSMVWPHDVARVLNETVTPAKLYELLVSPEGHLLLRSNVREKITDFAWLA